MTAVHLGDRPILVAACGTEPSLRELLDALRSVPHISPIVLPPTPIVQDALSAVLVASHVWQVFQNGDDCVISTDPSRQALIEVQQAAASAGKDLAWVAERINRWQAWVVRYSTAGSGRRAHLLFAARAGADAALKELGLKDLEEIRGTDGSIQRSRGSGTLTAIAPESGGRDFLVRAVERLREMDPALARLRPY